MGAFDRRDPRPVELRRTVLEAQAKQTNLVRRRLPFPDVARFDTYHDSAHWLMARPLRVVLGTRDRSSAWTVELRGRLVASARSLHPCRPAGERSLCPRKYAKLSKKLRSWWSLNSSFARALAGLALTCTPLILWWLRAVDHSWGLFLAALIGMAVIGGLLGSSLDRLMRTIWKWTDRPVGETYTKSAIVGCQEMSPTKHGVTGGPLGQPRKCPLGGCPADEPPPHEPDLTECNVKRDRLASLRNLMVWFFIFYVLSATLLYNLYSPSAAICLLLGVLAMVVASVGYHRPRRKLFYLFGVLGYIGLVNNQPDKNRFERMEDYYLSPVTLREDDGYYRSRVRLRDKVDFIYKPYASSLGGKRLQDPDVARSGFDATLVNNAPSLEAWRTTASEVWSQALCRPTKPKMVIVSVSGGATRSAYWSALVLERLSQILDTNHPEFPTFDSSVRIITGTSGGMVGTAYYVERLYREKNGVDPGKPRWVDELPLDCLTPLARYIMLRDLPRSLFPRFFQWRGAEGRVEEYDRGTFLEESWTYLGDRPLQHYARFEALGKIPSLILSPMMVEDGRLLLITNLDLSSGRWSESVQANQRFPVGLNVASPAVPRPDVHTRPMVVTAGSKITEDEDGATVGSYSLFGLEFFKLFPKATAFRVATAVRMNATFPFVSPAVSLPTSPPRHVVDAGYFDNYGVYVSTAWLHMNRDWLVDKTSGVLLIQIRDGLSVFDRWDIDDRDPSISKLIAQGYQFLLSPIQGAAKARSTTGMFRNDRDVESLSDWFTLKTGHREFFTTIVLENPAGVGVLTPPRDPKTLPGEDLIKIVHEPAKLTDAIDAKLEERNRLTELASALMGIEYHFDDISMSWHINPAERRAMDVTFPNSQKDAGTKETAEDEAARIERKQLLEDLIMTLKNTPRDYALRELVKIRNYARIIKLKDKWWSQDHSPSHQSREARR